MRVMQQQEQIVRLIPVTNWSTVETEKQEGSVFFLLGVRARQSLWTSAMVVNAFSSPSPSLSRFNPKLWVSLSNSEPNEGREAPPSPLLSPSPLICKTGLRMNCPFSAPLFLLLPSVFKRLLVLHSSPSVAGRGEGGRGSDGWLFQSGPISPLLETPPLFAERKQMARGKDKGERGEAFVTIGVSICPNHHLYLKHYRESRHFLCDFFLGRVNSVVCLRVHSLTAGRVRKRTKGLKERPFFFSSLFLSSRPE